MKLAVPKSKVIAYANLAEQEPTASPAPSGLEYDYYSSFAAYGSNPTLLYEAMKSYYGNTYDEATIQQMTAYYLQYFASMSGAAPSNTVEAKHEHDDDNDHDRRKDNGRRSSSDTLGGRDDRYRPRDDSLYESRSRRREYSPERRHRDDNRRARDPRSRSSRENQ